MTQPLDPAAPFAPDPALTRDGLPRRRRPRARPPVTVTPAMLEGAPDFPPAPREATRYDGWTPDRQRAFIKALGELGSVRRAADAVGLAATGAYQLRKAPGGEAFARAWAEALSHAVAMLGDLALDHALHGVPRPVFYKGEQVGERRWYDHRLLIWVLRHRDPEQYDAPMGHRVPPHVRKRLRAEWEAERAAESTKTGENAREWLINKINQMAERRQRYIERYGVDPNEDEHFHEREPLEDRDDDLDDEETE